MRRHVHCVGLFLLLVVSWCSAVGELRAQNRIVYVLAGQSNTWALGLPDAQFSTVTTLRGNLSYFAAVPAGNAFARSAALPFSLVQNTPLAELGDRLAQAHAPDLVEVVMMAIPGSALLHRNNNASFWIDETNFNNASSLGQSMAPVMTAIGQPSPPTKLHLIWGQGESDCLPPTTTFEYSVFAQGLFLWLASHAGVAVYEVHLVTLGALLTPVATDPAVDVIRDAFWGMERAPFPAPGFLPVIHSVAHHYDLPHFDEVHLTMASYFKLANRIGDGILNPAGMPKINSPTPTVVSATQLNIPTSVPLAIRPLGNQLAQFFRVEVNGTPIAAGNFVVGAPTGTLEVHILSGPSLLTATSISVRHVAGSGNGLSWQTTPPFAAQNGSVLEPFLAHQ